MVKGKTKGNLRGDVLRPSEANESLYGLVVQALQFRILLQRGVALPPHLVSLAPDAPLKPFIFHRK